MEGYCAEVSVFACLKYPVEPETVSGLPQMMVLQSQQVKLYRPHFKS